MSPLLTTPHCSRRRRTRLGMRKCRQRRGPRVLSPADPGRPARARGPAVAHVVRVDLHGRAQDGNHERRRRVVCGPARVGPAHPHPSAPSHVRRARERAKIDVRDPPGPRHRGHLRQPLPKPRLSASDHARLVRKEEDPRQSQDARSAEPVHAPSIQQVRHGRARQSRVGPCALQDYQLCHGRHKVEDREQR